MLLDSLVVKYIQGRDERDKAGIVSGVIATCPPAR